MDKNSPQPLSGFPAGSRVRIADFCETSSAKCRLCALGLIPGTVVRVVSGAGGTCRVRVKGTDLVLDSVLASTILAVPETD
jgi:ferrous iron transport protein A